MKPSRSKPSAAAAKGPGGAQRTQPVPPPEASLAPAPSAALRFSLLALLFLAACLPFLRATQQGFVEWDDDWMFVKNPNWRGLSEPNIAWMFDTMHMGHYQPLSWLSFALEYELWGSIPERMHLVNLLIHGISALLFARIATRLLDWGSGARPGLESAAAWTGGVVAALFFAVHPLRVESVAWATERRDVLSTVFLLTCVLCWLRTRDGGGGKFLWWILALAAYALSLLSKAWGMTLPALLVLLEVFPLRRVPATLRGLAASALSMWPFVPLAGWCAWKAMGAQESILAAVSWEENGLINRVAQASWGSAFYLWKTLLPTDLSPLYELEEQFDPFARGYGIAMAVVLALTLGLFLARRRFPAGLAAWCAFLILVSPVLGLFQSGAQKAADRYTYVACLPFALLLGAGVTHLVRRRQTGLRDPLVRGVLAGLTLAFAMLGAAAHAQTGIWKDSESLWRQVLAVEPESYIAHHNLAVTIGEQGRREEAIALEVRCIELRPGKGNVDARHYLGALYQRSGDTEKAFQTWLDAFHVDPEHAATLNSLDGEFGRRGERNKLLALFDEVLAKEPGRLGVRMEYARRLLAIGRGPDAESQYKAVLAQDPRHVPALVALGYVYELAGRIAEAEPLLTQAVRLDASNVDALTELGAVRAAQNRMQEASMFWSQALTLSPQHPRANALVRQYSGAGR